MGGSGDNLVVSSPLSNFGQSQWSGGVSRGVCRWEAPTQDSIAEKDGRSSTLALVVLGVGNGQHHSSSTSIFSINHPKTLAALLGIETLAPARSVSGRCD